MSQLSHTPSEEVILLARGYKLGRKLGEGCYAKVYLAEYKPEHDTERNSVLACKIIDTVNTPKDFVLKFLPRELNILIKLNHPHVVHVHSIFQRRTKYFIFMRFAENGDLFNYILKNGRVTESQARVWFRQLALGLQYLHEMEIAHRDIKCENVLVTSNFNVKLADFGFARYMIDSHGKHVLSDTYCGSLSYAAPEILRGYPYNPKMSDVWALGVILYIMLNKSMPFDEENLKRLYELQIARKWKFRSKVISSLTDCVKKLVGNLLEPEVSKRWHLDQIIQSDWIAMDPRLLILTPAEQIALNKAIEERKKFEEKLRKESTQQKIEKTEMIDEHKNDKMEEITILKDASKGTISTLMTA
ncbi:PREDICTED: testis-specific serine/threonine-protein kinase 1-like isoform X2 [Trachymyrmex septentrionalis]|uniref:testis-specific serine/threonine-protein kinase 1-like isoform X2 n=1 Tax=Trachymyrmex septentrionalis TaxID=34720 RepID=UPI00084EEF71|nr:PREDICTED: testis-specific serine/threonine-protein kinase 1-like isoform X2 [Trachymyrmex septentrionalis]